jgi:hypothetical protein
MTDPRPIDGNTPYEKLGVDRTLGKAKIVTKCKKKINEKSVEVKRLHASEDPQYKKSSRELSKMKDAVEELKKNHPEDGHPEPVDLSLSLETSNPSIKEPVTFRVTGDGNTISGISVNTDQGHSETTDDNGEVTFTFDTTESISVMAEGEFHHRSDVKDISIARKTISLQFSEVPSQLESGEEGRIRVTDQQGNDMESVPIMYENQQISRTNASGVATISFDNKGSHQIEATASDTDEIKYDSESTVIDVVATTIELNLQVPRGGLETGEDITFRVVDDQGTEVKGVAVSIDDGSSATTNSDGECELKFEKPGPRTIGISKSVDDDSVKYDEDEVTIEIGKGNSALKINSVKGEFEANGTVKIQITDENGYAVQNAEVTTNHGHKMTSDGDGWVELDVNSNKVLELEATKQSERIDYSPVEASFDIDEYQPSIRFEGLPNSVSQQETVRVRVVDENGNGVEQASIHSTEQRNKIWVTDDDGFAEITVKDHPGPEKFTADKDSQSFNSIAEEKVLVQ